MYKVIKFRTQEEYIKYRSDLIMQGYIKIGSAYWSYVYDNGADRVLLVREDD